MAMRSRNHRSWLITTAQPGNDSSPASSARSVSTSRSLVGSSSSRTLPPEGSSGGAGRRSRPLRLVLVMAADPELEPLVLVAAFRRPVKDRVVAHEELESAPPGLIGLVDDPVLQDESAEAGALGQVPSDVGAARAA